MQSDFEKRAAQAAVDAVERRWQRNQKLERRARGQKRLGLVALLLVALAGGVVLWQKFLGGNILSIPFLKGVSSSVELWTGDDPMEESREHYGEVLKFLLTGEAKLSSEMPEALRIKNAKPGARYTLLTSPSDGWFGLYELVRGPRGELTVTELSPAADPREVLGSDLRAACGGRPHLVAVQGQIYLFASKNLADATRLRSEVQALMNR